MRTAMARGRNKGGACATGIVECSAAREFRGRNSGDGINEMIIQ